MRPLTPKQKRFVEEYLIDLNATQAAIRAGYKPSNAMALAGKLVKKSHVRAAIDAAIEKRSQSTSVTANQVINELRRIAFSGMGKVATWTESGVHFIPSSELDEDTLASIQAVEETVNPSGGTLKIKQHDKLKALELLGKHLAIFTEKVQHTGPGGGPVQYKDMSDEALDLRIKELTMRIKPCKE